MLSIVPTPGVYMPGVKQWQPLFADDVALADIADLTVATLNVWFAADYFEERCTAALALLAAYQPDIIALQEVTPAFLEQVLQTAWVQANYRVSDIYGDSIDPYGVLILSRLPVREWQFVALPSAMGRHLVVAHTALGEAAISFASVHLESRSYTASTRAKQLARIFPLLASEQHVILTGDFNFCAAWDENQNLDSAYQDVWPALDQTQAGFTVDTDRNTMRLQHTGKHKQVRFDRMLLRSQQSGWQAESIEIIGQEPVHTATPHIFPSDHFGLVGTFTWRA